MRDFNILHFSFVEFFDDGAKRVEVEPEIIHHSYFIVRLFEKFLLIIVLAVRIFYGVELCFERAEIFFHVFEHFQAPVDFVHFKVLLAKLAEFLLVSPNFISEFVHLFPSFNFLIL